MSKKIGKKEAYFILTVPKARLEEMEIELRSYGHNYVIRNDLGTWLCIKVDFKNKSEMLILEDYADYLMGFRNSPEN